ncbi:hypothetical protein HOY80DRAFT_1140381 [Tuber brumale]|nr:hypothetical protein HOY80DRAFT_1140381 [Tuber brumale]
MTDKLDLHYLVALMSCALAGGGDDSLRCFNRSLHTPKHGIVDNPHINIRTFPVLDALAHISISQESCQVVAIALQLDSQNKRIRLTLAENKGVRDTLVGHLTTVWGKLQNLSDEYQKQRTEKSEDPLEKSPPIPPKVAISLKIEIFRDIYQYSLKKQMRRIEKWWEPLGGFMGELLQCRAVDELEGLERNMYSATVAVVSVVGLVSRLGGGPENTLTHAEWEMVYWYSMKANSDAKLVLDIDDGLDCEALALEIHNNRPKNPFPLRRALKKLTSQTNHIESLVGFAHSPRLRPALQYDMSISPVPNQPHNLRLPTSREEWKSFLETAFGGHQRWQGAQAVKLCQKLRSENYECPVHCECALIQYLQVKQHNNWDNVPVFSYIGVSKLSCSACRIWIETFNEQRGPEFHTRGSHGKWYWPWGVPREESLEEAEESLEEKMARKVIKEYLTQMRLPDPRKRASSDSSDASSSGAEHTLADDDLARTEAAGAKAVQKSGGSFNDFFHAQLSSFQQRRGSTKGAEWRDEPGPSDTRDSGI